MGVSLFETMRGHMVDQQGGVHLVDFDIKVESSHWSRMLRNGTARITGIVRARPWGDDATLEGSLTISPFRMRRITYDFTFQNEAEQEFHFIGHKTLNYLHPLRSMTHLGAKLWQDDRLLAEGELRFDLNDIPAFTTSLRPFTAFRRLDLDGPSQYPVLSTPLLNDTDQNTLAAYAEAIIAPGDRVPEADEETVNRVLETLPYMPPNLRTIYRGLLRTLDASAIARYGRRFASLSHRKRTQFTQSLNDNRLGGKELNLALSMPIKAAHFSRQDYLTAVEMPDSPPPAKETSPRWMGNVNVPEEMAQETALSADVVIIGTGAGGGPMAALLAEQGLAVAVIEEGRYQGRSQFSGSYDSWLKQFWRHGGMQFSVGNLPMPIPTGRLVGGTTAINSGTSFPTPEGILDEWRTDLGFPDDFTPDAFNPFVESVMRELQVAPGARRWQGDIADIVARGADALGGVHGPLPRNAPGCDGQGACVFGCPTEAKRSTNVSYIPRALRANAHLFTGLPVTRILRRGRRAVTVEARGHDNFGAKRLLNIRARAVVIACGALQSPLILQDNGIRLPFIGRNLSIHPALGMLVRSQGIHRPWNAIPQGYGVEGLVDDRVRFEGFWVPPQFSSASIPFVGEALTEWMDRPEHVGQFGFMVRDRNVGTVRRGKGGSAFIRYDITPDVLALFRKGSAVLAEMLIRGGAEEVLAGVGPVGVIRTIEEARAIAELKLRPRDFRAMAFHPLGSCRMGSSAQNSVVDFSHCVHGMDNLYVVDGSTVPTSHGVNPQVTIMAMAERAATLLGRRLEQC